MMNHVSETADAAVQAGPCYSWNSIQIDDHLRDRMGWGFRSLGCFGDLAKLKG